MKIKKTLYLIFGLLLIAKTIVAQDLVINEIMSSNTSIVSDEDNDYPDWIELYNVSDSDINLGDYSLSDDSLETDKWKLPSINMKSQEHLLVFASGKDRNEVVNHWETVIDIGEQWRYHYAIPELPANWHTAEYDETTERYWKEGISGFGHGDDDDATEISGMISFYIKKRFVVNDISKAIKTVLHVDYDDAFVAYLNGKEIARANIGTPGVPPAYSDAADGHHEAQIYQGGYPERFIIENDLVEGENVLALQAHDRNLNSSDMTLIPFLSLGMTEPPPNAQGPSQILFLESNTFHTNFKLSAQGEELYLSDPSGKQIDLVEAIAIPTDLSYGRSPDGSNDWLLFPEPTPGSENGLTGYMGMSTEPTFSQPAGFVSNQFMLTLEAGDDSIYYTRNGAIPTKNDSYYDGPFAVFNGNDSISVIRARSLRSGYIPSKTISRTYFLGKSYTIPVVSLTTEPANFFDEVTGIYVKGNEANDGFPYWGANFWSDCPHSNMREYGCENWERPVHIEFFEPDGQLGFEVDVGARIHGHWMRGLPQKCIAIIARNDYGYREINYQIFPDLPIDNFQGILLRQSGNDWSSSMFRDGLGSILGAKRDLDVMAFRPSILVINGEYWGIHNIREKINEHYVNSHHSVNIENLDLIENSYGIWPMYGTIDAYDAMIKLMKKNDLSIDENYQKIANQFDIDEYINYMIMELYANNWDWGGNRKRWYAPGRKWRWILNDLDAGFNQYPTQHRPPEQDIFENNGLPGFTEYQQLIVNKTFRDRFINSWADQLNTIFIPDSVIQIVDSLRAIIEPYMPAHVNKWKNTYIPGEWWIGDGINSMQEWYDDLDRLYDYPVKRESFAWGSIRAEFDLKGFYYLDVTGDKTQGNVNLNTIRLKEFPWKGKYFKEVPIELTALPKKNYAFSHWLVNGDTSYANPLILEPESATQVQVIFKEQTSSESNSIVINEINYNSADGYDPGDWVELYNNNDKSIDLSNWIFKDSEDIHSFAIPANTRLEPDSFLVLCRDVVQFRGLFPEISNYIGDFGFGLRGSGELIRLYNSFNELIDSLTYDDQPPWPLEADGTGSTLALKNPNLDNALPVNWSASQSYGTPGRINDVSTKITFDTEQIIPKKFYLYQNYPNPFNGQTLITYDLVSEGFVTLEIYNSLGQKIIQLERGFKNAGQYRAIWQGKTQNGSDAPSGIYYCWIYLQNANSEFTRSRKMLYIR